MYKVYFCTSWKPWFGRSAGSLDTEGDDRNRLQAVGRGSFRRWSFSHGWVALTPLVSFSYYDHQKAESKKDPTYAIFSKKNREFIYRSSNDSIIIKHKYPTKQHIWKFEVFMDFKYDILAYSFCHITIFLSSSYDQTIKMYKKEAQCFWIWHLTETPGRTFNSAISW